LAKTALELSQKEWREYRPSRVLEEREERESAMMAQRKKEAWNLAKRAAHLLRKEFAAERVVAFGSLAHGHWFTPWSDVDLAAWGIPPERFYAAVAAVTDLSFSLKIDLIDIETCRPALKTMIEKEGIEL
jgi:uncharacterized protein